MAKKKWRVGGKFQWRLSITCIISRVAGRLLVVVDDDVETSWIALGVGVSMMR